MNNHPTTCQACGHPHEMTLQEVLTEFFNWQEAAGIKDMLWRLYSTAIGSRDIDHWTAQERADATSLYKQISEFIEDLEALHLREAS